MTMLKEIEEKLRVAKEEVKRLTAERNLCRSINKVKLNLIPLAERLPPKEAERVQKAVEKYLGPERVPAVLSVCGSYLFHCEEVKPAQGTNQGYPSSPRPTKGRGRPPGTEDWCAKELVNELAGIWLDVAGKVPDWEQSRFDKFVREIGEALHQGTWSGIVRDVLNKDRSHSYKPEFLRIIPAVQERVALDIYYAVLSRMVEKMRIEEKIRTLPGTERIRKIIWDDDTERQ